MSVILQVDGLRCHYAGTAGRGQVIAAIMKEWHMVHNIVDGLPVEAVTTMTALKHANPNLTFGFVGMEGFSERLFRLQPFQIESLLGPAASDMDATTLDTAALRDLVQHLRSEADAIDFDAQDLRPVPLHKLTYNNLPNLRSSHTRTTESVVKNNML